MMTAMSEMAASDGMGDPDTAPRQIRITVPEMSEIESRQEEVLDVKPRPEKMLEIESRPEEMLDIKSRPDEVSDIKPTVKSNMLEIEPRPESDMSEKPTPRSNMLVETHWELSRGWNKPEEIHKYPSSLHQQTNTHSKRQARFNIYQFYSQSQGLDIELPPIHTASASEKHTRSRLAKGASLSRVHKVNPHPKQKSRNYFLERIAMQQDCVSESDSEVSTGKNGGMPFSSTNLLASGETNSRVSASQSNHALDFRHVSVCNEAGSVSREVDTLVTASNESDASLEEIIPFLHSEVYE